MFAHVRGVMTDLLNAIDDARDDASTTEAGVVWLDALEVDVEKLVRNFDSAVEKNVEELLNR